MSEHASRTEPAAIHPADPFEALGVEPAYQIDQASVERAWLRASAKLHPDRAGDDPSASTKLASINAAKETLADPERRARALFEVLMARAGTTIEIDERALPEGWLERTLEDRIEIDEALDAQDRVRIDELLADMREREREIIERVSALFASAADQTADTLAHTLGEVRVQLNAWRYITRAIDRLTGADGFE